MASEKITALIEEVKGLTVLELSELVHALEGRTSPSQTMRNCGRYWVIKWMWY